MSEEKKEKVPDYSKDFEKQLSYYKPMAKFFVILIFVSILFPFIALIFGFLESIAPYFLSIFFFPLVLAILPVYLMNKCPACGRYMGKSTLNFCPKCGVRIRHGKDD